MIAANVSRRYAKALLELGAESGTLDSLVAEIGRASDAYASSSELANALENPLVPHDAKKGILRELGARLSLGPVSINTLLLLCDRRRLRVLPGIAQFLREMGDIRKGIVRAEVTAAGPLSDAYYAKLQAQLQRITGKRVEIDKREDPSLIAGVVTRIGDTIYDGSLKARLQEIKLALLPN